MNDIKDKIITVKKQTINSYVFRPMLFSTSMVQAILEGRKTQTRRKIKHQPPKGNIKLIAKYAIDCLASGVILAHNHPSGNLKASNEDLAITKRIKEGLKILDISVLDHLILTSQGYLSFGDEGIL